MGCSHIFSTHSRCNTPIFYTLVILVLLDFSSQGHRVSSGSSAQCGIHPEVLAQEGSSVSGDAFVDGDDGGGGGDDGDGACDGDGDGGGG